MITMDDVVVYESNTPYENNCMIATICPDVMKRPTQTASPTGKAISQASSKVIGHAAIMKSPYPTMPTPTHTIPMFQCRATMSQAIVSTKPVQQTISSVR